MCECISSFLTVNVGPYHQYETSYEVWKKERMYSTNAGVTHNFQIVIKNTISFQIRETIVIANPLPAP